MTPTFTSSDLREMLESGADVRMIDVRTPAEFESAHVPGSYNVPLDTLAEHRDEIARHLEVPVVLVCRSGARAAQAEQRFAEISMSNVHVLDGGVTAWEAAGGELVRGRARWSLERQVRLVAGAIVASSILASTVIPEAKWVAGFVGGGLTFAALTDTCAMGMALAKLPYNRAASCDTDTMVAQLTRPNASQAAA